MRNAKVLFLHHKTSFSSKYNYFIRLIKLFSGFEDIFSWLDNLFSKLGYIFSRFENNFCSCKKTLYNPLISFLSLKDMARFKDQQRTDYIIQNWMRSRSTIEYLGVWEQLHNPDFKSIEFDGFRQQAGLSSEYRFKK